MEDSRQAAIARDNADAEAEKIMDDARQEAVRIRQEAVTQAEETAKAIEAKANEEAKEIVAKAAKMRKKSEIASLPICAARLQLFLLLPPISWSANLWMRNASVS